MSDRGRPSENKVWVIGRTQEEDDGLRLGADCVRLVLLLLDGRALTGRVWRWDCGHDWRRSSRASLATRPGWRGGWWRAD
jgi:hypothetical protein